MIYYTLYSITSTTSKYAENHKQNFPFFSVLCTQADKQPLIQGVLIHGMCNFQVRAATAASQANAELDV